MNSIVDLVVQVGGEDVDEADAADLSRVLREELLSLDVESVRPVDAGDVPPGAKSGGAIEIGACVWTVECSTSYAQRAGRGLREADPGSGPACATYRAFSQVLVADHRATTVAR